MREMTPIDGAGKKEWDKKKEEGSAKDKEQKEPGQKTPLCVCICVCVAGQIGLV